MGFGAVLYFLGAIKLFDQSRDFMVRIGTLGLSKVRLGAGATAPAVSAGGFSTSRLRPSARLTSAWDTSSARDWPR